MSEIVVPPWRPEWGHNPPHFANARLRQSFFDHIALGMSLRSCAGIVGIGHSSAKGALRRARQVRAKAERGEVLEKADPFWLSISFLHEEALARGEAALVRSIQKAAQGATEEVVVGRNGDGTMRTKTRRINPDHRAAIFLLRAREAGAWNFEKRLQVDAVMDTRSPIDIGGDDLPAANEAPVAMGEGLSFVGMPLEHLDRLIAAFSDEESHEEILDSE